MPKTNNKIIIAIDGPAGAGKSTVAKLIAEKLGFIYIDTGAMYRSLALKVKRLGLNLENEKKITELAEKTSINLQYHNNKLKVILDNEDVSEEIRKPYITDRVSEVAKIKEVRKIMTNLQRQFAKNNNCVLEGRDIGTVVFPNAQYKFYLDADFTERTKRRFKELKEKKEKIQIMAVEKDLSQRDRIDSTRETAPLKKAQDAVYIDSTNLSIQQVVDKISLCIKI